MSEAPPDRVHLGTIVGVHGIRGEVKIRSFTETPEAIASYGPLSLGDSSREVTIMRFRSITNGIIAALQGISDRNAAESLRGEKLFVPRERLPEPEEDEFYLVDLIGLTAVEVSGDILGEVIAVENFGAGDLLEIKRAGTTQTLYVPFTREIVPTVDLAGGCITVALIEGLE